MSALHSVCSRGGTGRRNGLKILSAISQDWQFLRIRRVSASEVTEIRESINKFFVTYPSQEVWA